MNSVRLHGAPITPLLMLSLSAAAASDNLGGVPAAVQDVPSWHLVEELRIGSLNGDHPAALSAVGQLAVDRLGRVWVYDRLEHHIKVFSSDGSFVRMIGRSGAGPGEFKGVIGMAWDPNGRLWVVDAGNARYSVFDTTGVLVADYRRPVHTYDARWVGGFATDGRFFDQAYLPATRDRLPQALLYVSEGIPLDTIMLPDYTRQAARRGSMWFPLPFSRKLILAFDPRGFVWHGVTDKYEITRRSLQGVAEVVFHGPAQARALSRTERDSVRQYLDAAQREFGVSYSQSMLPQVYPIFDGLYLTDDGEQLWVKRTDETDGSVFDVFDRRGALQAAVFSEASLTAALAPVIVGDRIWAVVLGELDVPYVVRFRVVK